MAVTLTPSQTTYAIGDEFTVSVTSGTPSEDDVYVRLVHDAPAVSHVIDVLTLNGSGAGTSALFAIPSNIAAGSDYYITVQGDTTDQESPLPHFAITADAEWFYADQDDVEDLIGTEALRLISNEPGATTSATTDSARVLRAGLWADQYMDGRLAVLGYVTPLANTSAGTDLLMADASAKLVAWKLNEPRMLTSISGSRNASSIDKVMMEHRKSADSTLSKLSWRQIVITADKLYTRPPYAKVSIASASDNSWAGSLLAL